MMILYATTLVSGLAICLAKPQVVQTYPEGTSSSNYLPPIQSGAPTTGFQTLPGQTTYTDGWTRPSFPPSYPESTYIGPSIQVLPDSTASMTKPWVSSYPGMTKPWSTAPIKCSPSGCMTKPWSPAPIKWSSGGFMTKPWPPAPIKCSSGGCMTKPWSTSPIKCSSGGCMTKPWSTAPIKCPSGGCMTKPWPIKYQYPSAPVYNPCGTGLGSGQGVYGTGQIPSSPCGTNWPNKGAGACGSGTILRNLMPSCGNGYPGPWNTGTNNSPVVTSGFPGTFNTAGPLYYRGSPSLSSGVYGTGTSEVSGTVTSGDCGSCGK